MPSQDSTATTTTTTKPEPQKYCWPAIFNFCYRHSISARCRLTPAQFISLNAELTSKTYPPIAVATRLQDAASKHLAGGNLARMADRNGEWCEGFDGFDERMFPSEKHWKPVVLSKWLAGAGRGVDGTAAAGGGQSVHHQRKGTGLAVDSRVTRSMARRGDLVQADVKEAGQADSEEGGQEDVHEGGQENFDKGGQEDFEEGAQEDVEEGGRGDIENGSGGGESSPSFTNDRHATLPGSFETSPSIRAPAGPFRFRSNSLSRDVPSVPPQRKEYNGSLEEDARRLCAAKESFILELDESKLHLRDMARGVMRYAEDLAKWHREMVEWRATTLQEVAILIGGRQREEEDGAGKRIPGSRTSKDR